MLSVARRYSFCVDDAHDAWQRSLEILIRRAPTLDPETAAAWLRTVVRNEALAVRADRTRHLGSGDAEPDLHPGGADPVREREQIERIEAAAEALQRLKPQETEAFLLLASGLSYREIADLKGWTYTKVNRLLTEGRQSFRDRIDGIESGAECGRWSESITRIADGEASESEVAEVEPHLRRCVACRAALRSDRQAHRSLALVLPGLLAVGEQVGSPPFTATRSVLRSIADGLLLVGVRLQGSTEALASSKAVAVVASAAAIAGGGAAVEKAVAPVPKSPPSRAGLAATGAAAPSRTAGQDLPAPASEGSSPHPDADTGGPRASSVGNPEPEFDPLAVDSGQDGSGTSPTVPAEPSRSTASGSARGPGGEQPTEVPPPRRAAAQAGEFGP